MISKSKRGNIFLEAGAIIFFLLVGIFVVYVGDIIVNQLDTSIQASAGLPNASKSISATIHASYEPTVDAMVAFIWVGLFLFVIISAYLIDTHPLLMMISVMLIAIVIMLSTYVSTIYSSFTADSNLSAIVPNFPMTNYIMTHLVPISVVMSLVMLLVLYGKVKARSF